MLARSVSSSTRTSNTVNTLRFNLKKNGSNDITFSKTNRFQPSLTRDFHTTYSPKFKNQFDALKNAFKMAESIAKNQKDGKSDGFPFDQKQLEEMMKNMPNMPFPPNMQPNTSSDWFPAVDVVEGNESFIYYFDVPGLQKGDIKLKVKGEKLFVSGERPSLPKDHLKVKSSERWSGSFSKELDVNTSKMDLSKTKAVCQDGVLTVTIPKKTPDKDHGQDIEIN
eukprot:gb/GECH01014690.1/.p1 GENE.gb/GECH01014690.1/~~gb/GECH01014690.1/.p1  ORF type:complete len:223 (+),score=59.43 gb/GECH01014690.1/:1-669(+)